jgi:hypothetical protein
MALTGGFGAGSSQSGLFYSSSDNTNSIFPTYDDQIITTPSGLHSGSGVGAGVDSSIRTSNISLHNPSGYYNPYSIITENFKLTIPGLPASGVTMIFEPPKSPAGSGVATDHTSQSGINQTSVGINASGYPTTPPDGFDPDAPSTLPGGAFNPNIGAP